MITIKNIVLAVFCFFLLGYNVASAAAATISWNMGVAISYFSRSYDGDMATYSTIGNGGYMIFSIANAASFKIDQASTAGGTVKFLNSGTTVLGSYTIPIGTLASNVYTVPVGSAKVQITSNAMDVYEVSVSSGDMSPPATPSNFSAQNGVHSVILSWNASAEPDFDHYQIYKNGAKLVTATGLSYTDTAVTQGSTYTYQITAVDTSTNESTKSAVQSVTIPVPDTTAPAVPSGLAVTAMNKAVSVKWNAVSDSDLAGYNLYRDGVKVNTSVLTSTSFTDSNLTNGTNYTYSVSAVDSSGNESGFSPVQVISPINAATTSFGTVAFSPSSSVSDILSGVGKVFTSFSSLSNLAFALTLVFFIFYAFRQYKLFQNEAIRDRHGNRIKKNGRILRVRDVQERAKSIRKVRKTKNRVRAPRRKR